MNHLSPLIAIVSLCSAAQSGASPAAARQIEKTWESAMQRWSLETRVATTPEERAKTFASRPDASPAARKMWQLIGPALDQDWTLEPAAWFLRVTPGLLSSNPNGTTAPTFQEEIDTIRKAVDTYHVKSPKLTPMCMALAGTHDPRSLATLEKIAADNPDKKVQGVAALAAAMILKNLGDDPELMRKRLTYLREAIIQSSEVEVNGSTVAQMAEDELYIIRFLTKGRVAPDLGGTDAAGRPFKLSDYKGKVVLLLFWKSTMQETERVIEITAEMARKFEGRPFVLIGVNQDPLPKLKSMVADGSVPWRNFSDPDGKLTAEYRVGSWPLAYVLDGDRKIHYAGAQGSFAELTAEALLAEQ